MGEIHVLQERLARIPNLTRLTAEEVDTLRQELPGLPCEYLEFLSVVGFGNLEELQLYNRPTSAKSIYPQPKGDLSGIVLFGDDFQGYCFGFDTTKDFCLVEVDPRGNPRSRSENGFVSLIAANIPE